MSTGSIITCGICGMLHGQAIGQCPLYLQSIEAEARGRAAGEAMGQPSIASKLDRIIQLLEGIERRTK
jgi:hypothetical protein